MTLKTMSRTTCMTSTKTLELQCLTPNKCSVAEDWKAKTTQRFKLIGEDQDPLQGKETT